MSGAGGGLLAGTAMAGTTVLLALPSRPRQARTAGDARTAADVRTRDAVPGAGSPLGAAHRAGRTRSLWVVGVAGALALLVAPPLVVPIVASGWIVRRRRAALARRAVARAVTNALPDAVDLLLLCTSAGQSLPIAHPLVAARVAPPLGDALQLAAREADAGRPRADALVAALTPLGDRAAGLAHALADHLRYGIPVTATLERWSAELRGDRRRLAEEAARRAPVRLLAPLILCVLPAFALLTVVPLLVASLQALPT